MVETSTALKITRLLIAGAGILALAGSATTLAIVIAFVFLFSLVFPEAVNALIANLEKKLSLN